MFIFVTDSWPSICYHLCLLETTYRKQHKQHIFWLACKTLYDGAPPVIYKSTVSNHTIETLRPKLVPTHIDHAPIIHVVRVVLYEHVVVPLTRESQLIIHTRTLITLARHVARF